MFTTKSELSRIADHLSPIDGALVKSAAEELSQRRQGHPMFDKNQLPDITEREAAFELHKAYEEADDAYFRLLGEADPEAVRLAKAKSDEALSAYDAAGVDLMLDQHGNAIRCALSGAPVVEIDDVFCNLKTDQCVLSLAIGVWPLSPEEQLLPDMEEVA
jgi:hypothetical protein